MDKDYYIKRRFLPVCHIVQKYYNGREVIFLGDQTLLRELLKDEYGIKSTRVTTRNLDLIREKYLLPFSALQGKSDEAYIVIPWWNYDTGLIAQLNKMEYAEFQDFVFAKHRAVNIPPDTKEYHDEYRNDIYSPGGYGFYSNPTPETTLSK